MAVWAKANNVVFYLYNTSRELATPPVIFPDVNSSAHFTYSIWVYPRNNVPVGSAVFYAGTDGSYFSIGHDGTTWYFNARKGSVALPTQYFATVVLNAWTVICIAKDGPVFHIFTGTEDLTNPAPWTVPVTLTYPAAISYEVEFPFSYCAPVSYSNLAICNFKFWNYTLTQAELQIQCHRWDGQTGGSGPAPMWASPLRTPGDLSNVANPYASMTWSTGHAYTLVWLPNSLAMHPDPQYMANTQVCPAWVYPIPTPGFPAPYSSVNPGQTPLVPTIYKAPQFYKFEDRGSVPTLDHQIQNILHYGWPFKGGPGPYATDTWGLYKDELGTEISPNLNDPNNRFEQDTVVAVPFATSPIKASTMYSWQFGAQFRYLPSTPQVPTGDSALGYILLYVTFIGYPSGIPLLSSEKLAGLFAIKKGQLVDKYNLEVELKIPDPTIRTAYIGE